VATGVILIGNTEEGMVTDGLIASDERAAGILPAENGFAGGTPATR